MHRRVRQAAHARHVPAERTGQRQAQPRAASPEGDRRRLVGGRQAEGDERAVRGDARLLHRARRDGPDERPHGWRQRRREDPGRRARYAVREHHPVRRDGGGRGGTAGPIRDEAAVRAHRRLVRRDALELRPVRVGRDALVGARLERDRDRCGRDAPGAAGCAALQGHGGDRRHHRDRAEEPRRDRDAEAPARCHASHRSPGRLRGGRTPSSRRTGRTRRTTCR